MGSHKGRMRLSDGKILGPQMKRPEEKGPTCSDERRFCALGSGVLEQRAVKVPVKDQGCVCSAVFHRKRSERELRQGPKRW